MALQFTWERVFLLPETYLWKSLRIFIYVFKWLYFNWCLTSFPPRIHTLFYMHRFWSVSLNMTRLSQSMYLPVSGEFNIHHNDWLTYSEGQISFFLFFLWSRGGASMSFTCSILLKVNWGLEYVKMSPKLAKITLVNTITCL